MTAVMKAVDGIALWLFRAAGVVLLIMGTAVIVDIVGRAAYRLSDGAVDLTLVGGPEIVAYSLMFTVLLGLPHAVDRGQVVVDLLGEVMGGRTKDRLAAFYYFGFAVLGTAMAVRLALGGEEALASGVTTQVYQVPLGVVYFPAAALTALLGLRAFLVAVTVWRRSTR